MATQTTAPDIVRGEKRLIDVNFGDEAFPAGAATWNLSLVVTQTKGGAATFTVTFGAAEYVSNNWLISVSTTNSNLLTYGLNTYATVKRTDSGFEQVLGTQTWTVG